MIKKFLYCAGAAAIVVAGVRLQEAYNQQLARQQAMANEQTQTQNVDAESSVVRFQDPTQPALDQTTRKVEALANRLKEAGDPLAQRQLDFPVPASKRELLTNMTDFKEPLLPKLGDTTDSDVKTIYRGFYEAEPGKFRRIEFNRTQSISVSVEDVNSRFPTYHEDKDEFMIHNFKDDPYSVVMTLRDMRVIYLKFYPARRIPDYADPSFRILSGWVLDGSSKRVAGKVALIDSRKPELADLRTPGQYVWPRLRAIQQLMPTAELPD